LTRPEEQLDSGRIEKNWPRGKVTQNVGYYPYWDFHKEHGQRAASPFGGGKTPKGDDLSGTEEAQGGGKNVTKRARNEGESSMRERINSFEGATGECVLQCGKKNYFLGVKGNKERPARSLTRSGVELRATRIRARRGNTYRQGRGGGGGGGAVLENKKKKNQRPSIRGLEQQKGKKAHRKKRQLSRKAGTPRKKNENSHEEGTKTLGANAKKRHTGNRLPRGDDGGGYGGLRKLSSKRETKSIQKGGRTWERHAFSYGEKKKVKSCRGGGDQQREKHLLGERANRGTAMEKKKKGQKNPSDQMRVSLNEGGGPTWNGGGGGGHQKKKLAGEGPLGFES